jgi:hypothetical protein
MVHFPATRFLAPLGMTGIGVQMRTKRMRDVTLVATLDKLRTEFDQLPVDGEVLLRRLNDEDNHFLSGLVTSGLLSRYAPRFEFALETRAISPEDTFNPGEAEKRFDRVITAFRLIKPGAVRVSVVFACQTESRALVGVHVPPVLHVFGKPYSFAGEDAHKLRDVVRQLCAPKLNDRQRIALRRFEMAYEREAAEDRLIDCWVALEALFSPSDRGELRHRIALRAAYFIASSPEERERTYTALRDCYDTRSDIIHGSKPRQDVRAAAAAVEDYLRGALRKIVSNPAGFQADQLDLVVARGQF